MGKFLFLVCMFWLACLQQMQAQNATIVLRNKTEVRLIGKNIYFLEDKEGQLTLKDILKPDFQQQFESFDRDVFAQLASPSSFWFKIKLQNLTQEDVWLEVGGSFACWYVDFYAPDSLGNYQVPIATGSLRPWENRQYPVNMFWLPLADAQDTRIKEYYVCMRSQMPHEYPLQVGTRTALLKNKERYDYLTAGFCGWIIVMVLYNLFLAWAMRDSLYIVYVGYLLNAGFNLLFINNYPIFTNPFWWEYFGVWSCWVLFFITLFANHYLELRVRTPRLYTMVWSLVAILVIIIPIMNIAGVAVYKLIGYIQIILIFVYGILTWAGIHLWKKGYRNARFYLLAWSAVVISTFTLMLVVNGLIPFNILTRNSLFMGTCVEILMFSLALADRLNALRHEKEKIQSENLRLVQEQNKILEEKVAEKTFHLQEKSSALETANEELHQQQEELLTLNETLKTTYDSLKATSDRLNTSIRYAQNLQQNILPKETELRHYFADYFAIYLPKDTVSGDFYWFSQISPAQALFVVADCTGHGVPGAFMTMTGNTLLHEIINIKKAIEPSRILKNLSSAIQKVLRQKESQNADGMDITVCFLEKTEKETQVVLSSVKLLTYYSTGNGELTEIRGDRTYIGGHHKKENNFSTHLFSLMPDAVLYFASDGYIDQHNKDGQRIGAKTFKYLLEEIMDKPMPEQEYFLLQKLKEHQDTQFQRDDITVVGLRLTSL